MAFTYFFRDLHTLELTVKHVVPKIIGRSNVNIWDAGCAMGMEAYTLAILFAEKMGRFAFKNLKIFATDIDNSNLFEKIISEGLYKDEEIKRIPGEILNKYFKPSIKPGYYEINELMRSKVHYQKHDLLSLKLVKDGFSLIICKNVLLHLTYNERINVIKMFHQALSQDGYLAMEQTQKLPKETEHLFKKIISDGQLFIKI